MGSPIRPYDPMASKGRDDDDDRTASYFPHVHRSKYDLNSRIMLTAIISLSVVVLLVIALHVYARYVLRRQARRRRAALQRLGLSVSRARSAEQPAPPAKRGLDPSLIASLPLLPFEPPTATAAAAADDAPASSSPCHECAVCLGALEAGEMVRLLPACRHTFHAVCIDTWLAAQSTCPVCRAEVDPTPPRPVLLPEPREAPTAPPLSSLAAAVAAAPSSSSSSCMGLETTSCSSEQAVVSNKAALSNNTSNGNGGSNRLSLSFRRMLSRDQRSSSRIIQPSFGQLDQDVIEDLERQ